VQDSLWIDEKKILGIKCPCNGCRNCAEEKKQYLAQDSETLIAMHTAFLDSPSLTDRDLESISLPCLVFCGELDEGGFHTGAKEGAGHIPKAQFVSFANLGHYQTGARSDLVVPHIKEFLAGVD
jgi:pimeloyl-ACP methyl ester carboxylesterase